MTETITPTVTIYLSEGRPAFDVEANIAIRLKLVSPLGDAGMWRPLQEISRSLDAGVRMGVACPPPVGSEPQ